VAEVRLGEVEAAAEAATAVAVTEAVQAALEKAKAKNAECLEVIEVERLEERQSFEELLSKLEATVTNRPLLFPNVVLLIN
jgi:hypothetical protein